MSVRTLLLTSADPGIHPGNFKEILLVSDAELQIVTGTIESICITLQRK